MLSIKNNFLFIHIPKTGGNSIQHVLKRYSEDEIVAEREHQDGNDRFAVRNKKYGLTKHSPLFEYKKAIGYKFDKMFKFSTIRNPWERAVSLYFSPHNKRSEFHRDEFIRVIESMRPIGYYIKDISTIKRIKIKMGMSVNYSNILSDIDFLIRFEHLNSDFNHVCNKIGVEEKKLPKKNESSRGHYSKYYDRETKEIIERKFAEEIKVGGYRFEN